MDKPQIVLNCEMAFVCHKKWDELDPTDRLDVKNCNECKKDVYFAKNQQELKERTEAGVCVCVALAGQDGWMMGSPMRPQAF
jgi:hypothetical protein